MFSWHNLSWYSWKEVSDVIVKQKLKKIHKVTSRKWEQHKFAFDAVVLKLK